MTRSFCDSCDRIRLTADGRFRNCLFAVDEFDLQSLLRSGASDDEVGELLEGAVRAKWAGHGIGRVLHEDPVAGWSRPVTADFEVVPGLVLAVEPVVTSGDGRLSLSKDGWTLSTVDGHPTVHFERTVAVTEAGVTVLTGW